jgi:hypothetical protein
MVAIIDIRSDECLLDMINCHVLSVDCYDLIE